MALLGGSPPPTFRESAIESSGAVLQRICIKKIIILYSLVKMSGRYENVDTAQAYVVEFNSKITNKNTFDKCCT